MSKPEVIPEGENAGQAYGLTNCSRCSKLTNDFYFSAAGATCPDCLTVGEWRHIGEAARAAAFSFRQAAIYKLGSELWKHWHEEGERHLAKATSEKKGQRVPEETALTRCEQCMGYFPLRDHECKEAATTSHGRMPQESSGSGGRLPGLNESGFTPATSQEHEKCFVCGDDPYYLTAEGYECPNSRRHHRPMKTERKT